VVAAPLLLVTRFVHLRKVAPLAEFVREDTLKVSGRKVNCAVIQMMAREYWIDTSRFLILKEVEVIRKKIQGGGELTTKTSVTWKDADINSAVDDSVFAFTPPDKAKEVELLDIPWQRRVTLTGTHATDFGLKDLEGNEVTLSSLRGKVVLLNFWATWCPPCRKELPTIEALHKEFSGKGLVILGVNDEEKGTVRGFVKQNGYTFPTLLDTKSQAQKAYRAYSIPTLVLIDRQGLIVNHLVGGRGEPELRAALIAAGL
jgi:thiol-disulfide isomerase/thioredoxin